MFGPAGHLYVYFTYGMHFCSNVVCDDEGEAGAVLLRGLTPVAGMDEIRAVRPTSRRDGDLCAGPGRLCLALGIDRAFDGADLVTGDRGVAVLDDGIPPPETWRSVAGSDCRWPRTCRGASTSPAPPGCPAPAERQPGGRRRRPASAAGPRGPAEPGRGVVSCRSSPDDRKASHETQAAGDDGGSGHGDVRRGLRRRG